MGIDLTADMQTNLGPLAPLAGTFEGEKGDDTAPGDDRGIEKNLFRERIEFTPIDLAENHEQKLQGLQYVRTAWRLGVAKPFHAQLGYWLWDAKARQLFHSFMIPRGMTVLAGASCDAKAREIRMVAEVGSPTFGICSNPFLDAEFRTVRYEMKLTIDDQGFSYEEDTQILMKGRQELFHHVDKNTLRRV